MNNTIFDDVFRTMIEKMPSLAVPLINEVFHTSYPEDVKITQLRNEHQQEDGEVITDSCLLIGRKMYHIECQSTDDMTMVIRMIEYDFAIGIEHAEKQGRRYRIEFPKSCVLFLRSSGNTPDYLEADVVFPDGNTYLYSIPAIKMADYTKDSIFEKNLLMLLPFYIMRYEKVADIIEKDSEKLQRLLSEYEDITSSLNMTFASSTILPEVDATERVKQNVLAKNVIDFDMLMASIPKDILNEKAFNKRTKELIENLAFVYNLDTMQFSEIIKNVINERGYIVAEELRKLARNYYTYHNNGKLPTLVYKEEKTSPLENMSKRDKIIYVFENTKPYDFLKNKYHGITPTNRFLIILNLY